MFAIEKTYLQKYIQPYIKTIEEMDYTSRRYYYETTVTFNPQYWTLTTALRSINQVIADLLKPIIKNTYKEKIQIAYCVEYHVNGYPHIHAQILTKSEVDPEDQRNIHQRLCRRYGKSQWYQTGEEDMVHINEKFPEGIKWSDYIRKDVLSNQLNGQTHYYQYQLGQY